MDLPPLIDTSIESYRLLYLSMAATGASIPVVTVVGAEAAIAAAVAANVAVAAAEDGRSTLVIDADGAHAAASVAFGVGQRLGLADVLHGGLPVEAIVSRWPSAAGPPCTSSPPAHGCRAPRGRRPLDRTRRRPAAALARVAREYDITVTSLPPVAAALPAADGANPPRATPESGARDVLAREVIVCARAGHTPLAGLTREIARLNGLGAHVRGLVIWEGDPPAFLS